MMVHAMAPQLRLELMFAIIIENNSETAGVAGSAASHPGHRHRVRRRGCYGYRGTPHPYWCVLVRTNEGTPSQFLA